MSDAQFLTVHLCIIGRVQGVGFRESLRYEAERLDVNGWVRNRHDGSVEAMLQGDSDAIEQLIAWCHRGPPGANVKDVQADKVEAEDRYIAFTRWPTV